MICPVCKTQNSSTSKFCIICGTALKGNTVVCPNGHIYDSSLSKCPYCPSTELKELIGETRTFIDNPYGSDAGKTSIASIGAKQGSPSDLKRTIIVGGKDEPSGGTSEAPSRKIIGWLVTFTWNKNGDDYKIYEGRNLIGSNPSSDILINDPSISTNHCLLLFRSDKLRIKDELSTNGTYVNGMEIDETEIHDGDIIKIGTTELKFRQV